MIFSLALMATAQAAPIDIAPELSISNGFGPVTDYAVIETALEADGVTVRRLLFIDDDGTDHLLANVTDANGVKVGLTMTTETCSNSPGLMDGCLAGYRIVRGALVDLTGVSGDIDLYRYSSAAGNMVYVDSMAVDGGSSTSMSTSFVYDSKTMDFDGWGPAVSPSTWQSLIEFSAGIMGFFGLPSVVAGGVGATFAGGLEYYQLTYDPDLEFCPACPQIFGLTPDSDIFDETEDIWDDVDSTANPLCAPTGNDGTTITVTCSN